MTTKTESLKERIRATAGEAYSSYVGSKRIQRENPDGCWNYVADQILTLIQPSPDVGELGALFKKARDSAAEAERNHRLDPNCSSTAASDAVEAYENVLRTTLAGTESVWRPIESAPKDGTHVLLFLPQGWQAYRFQMARWQAKDDDIPEGYWEGSGHSYFMTNIGGEPYADAPTHWMPLPEAPK